MWALSRLDAASAEFSQGVRRVRLRVRQPRAQRVGEHGRRRGRPSRRWRWSRSIACAKRPTPPIRPGSSRSAPSSAPAASAELLAMVAADPATHGQLAAAIGCSAAWLPGRERTKTNNIRVIHEMRMAMRELGRRMVERGAFDEIEDFGFVREAEMPTLLTEPQSLTDEIRSAPCRVPASCRSSSRRSCSSGTPTAPTPGRDAMRPAPSGCRQATPLPDFPAAPAWPRASPRVDPRLQRPVGAAAGRRADRAHHRPVVDSAVRAGRRRWWSMSARR